MCGLFETLIPGWTKIRRVSHLCPHAPLANDFASGQIKLVPSIFCHGNSVGSEEHFCVPMMIASHGFMVVSLDFMDGTAPHCTDKNGKDIFIAPYNNG